MRTVILTCFVLMSLCHSTGFAQQTHIPELYHILDTTTNDSLKGATFYNLAFAVRLSDLKKAEAFSDSGLVYFEEAGDAEGIHLKEYLDATLAYAAGDYQRALSLNQKYYDWTISAQNILRQSYAASAMAKFYRETGILSKAIEFTLEGIALQDSMGRSDESGFYYAELGDLYYLMQQWDSSLEYTRKAYDLAVRTGYAPGQSTSLRNMASIAIELAQYDSARTFIRQAINIDSLHDYHVGISRGYQELAGLLEKRGDPEASFGAYLTAMKHIEGTDNSVDFAMIYQGLTRVLIKLDRISEAQEYHTKSKEAGGHVDALKFRADQHKLSAELYARAGQFEQAYLASIQYQEARDELLSRDIANRITGLNTVFETEKKEQEIALLNTEKEVSALRLAASNRRTLGLAAGLILLAVLSLVLFRFNKKIKTQNALISKALDEKNILLREIHHRVKNNLQVISSLLNLQSRYVVDPGALHALKEGKDRVRSMALIHQNLYQKDNLTGIDMSDYFSKLTQSLFNSYNIDPDRISLELDIQSLNLDVETVIPLGLIVNELITNALKHAFPGDTRGTVQISMREQANVLWLSVSDNGIGMPDTSLHESADSFGLRLINIFRDKLNADLHVRNHQGTEVRLEIRDYRKAG